MNKKQMIKRAYAISMTYEVSDAEKQQAEKALLFFNHALKLLALSSDNLNLMKTPFKDSEGMSSESVMQARAAIRRFRDQAIENFNDFKKASFKCVKSMQDFASDTQTIKLMKSFISSVDDLEEKVNNFADLFNDLENNDFSKLVVENIEKIQDQCKDVEEIINDRIKSHIRTNILAKSWVDSVSHDLQMKIEKKTPLLLDLFNKRQDEINNTIKGENK